MARPRLPAALRHREFRNYLTGAFISNVGSNVQASAIAWHVYHLTGSSFMVGMLGLARVVPLLLFALFGGVLADQADRRKVMLATQTTMALLALLLFYGATQSGLPIAGLFAIVSVNSIARAFDGPARQALQVGLVPIEDYPQSASLNGVAWRMSDVLGPIIAGFMIAWSGIGSYSGLALCYFVNFLSFLAVIIAVWHLRGTKPPEPADRPRSVRDVFRQIGEGWTFVNRTPPVRHAMWIDFWATFLSGAEALLPAFAHSILRLGPQGFGILSASGGIGALIAAGGMSIRPTIRHQGRVVIMMIASYGLFTIFFGLSQNLWMAAFCLALVGASDMISTVLRQTIRQLATPDELRGRMNATCSLFHMSGPQLGDFEAGAVARFGGERFSIVLGGALCMLVAAHWTRAKQLVDYVHD